MGSRRASLDRPARNPRLPATNRSPDARRGRPDRRLTQQVPARQALTPVYAPPGRGGALADIDTAEGRTLAYALWGDPNDFPVLVLHGTPGCRLERWPDEDVYRRLGILLVTHDRAGYGRSTRRPGRRIVDEVDDVAALADHLGFEQFGVTGGSGGGAHSLACAARLPDRVVRAACVVGVAPFGEAGLSRRTGSPAWTRRTSRSSAGLSPARRS